MFEGLLTKLGHLCISERKVSQMALEMVLYFLQYKYRASCNTQQSSRTNLRTTSRHSIVRITGCKQ
jgi:hypothetical protein